MLSKKLVLILLAKLVLASATQNVLILITSQDTNYHRQLAQELQQNITTQTQTNDISKDYVINVELLHEIFKHPGDWTLLNALPHLTSYQVNWIVVCEESTHVELQPILKLLTKENHEEALYLGHALYDSEATIIHHFAFFENPKWFPYPMLRAGVIISGALFRSLAALLEGPPNKQTDFTIDAAHELARFIFDNVRYESDSSSKTIKGHSESVMGNEIAADAEETSHSNGSLLRHKSATLGGHEKQQQKNVREILLKDTAHICACMPIRTVERNLAKSKRDSCFMYAKPMATTKCVPTKRETIYFAIKTFKKFHTQRVPIIEATWAAYAAHKRYFSNDEDATIPTINAGVPNVETGHCAKTLSILKLALKDIRQIQLRQQKLNQQSLQWIYLCDDDTLVSISRLLDFIGCFDPNDKIYLGERYGYRLHAADGFNYITGGGGIVFSLPTVELIVKHCSCPTASAPDDMILGACLHALQVRAIHSSRFHQARPNDYAKELLHVDPPISFHKFWQLDPRETYKQWFANADRRFLHSVQPLKEHVLEFSNSSNNSHRSAACIDKTVNGSHQLTLEDQSFKSDLTAYGYTKNEHLDL